MALTDEQIDALRGLRSELNRIDNLIVTTCIDGKVSPERVGEIKRLLLSAGRLTGRLA